MNLNRQYQGLLHTILSMGIQDGGRLYLPSMLINHRMTEGFPALNFRKLDLNKGVVYSGGEICKCYNRRSILLKEECHFWQEFSFVDLYKTLPDYLIQAGFFLKVLARFHNRNEGELTILLNAPFIELSDKPDIIKLLNCNPDRFKLPELVGPIQSLSELMDSTIRDFQLVNYETFE